MVLRQTGKDAGLFRYGGNKRQWIVISCDDLPFRRCDRIIHETRCCTKCGLSFFGEEAYTAHYIEAHDSEKVPYFLEFEWVLRKPGGAHVEMNPVKAFLELNWVPYCLELAHQMRFNTPETEHVAKKCSDHHKAWDMLLVFYFGSFKELASMYVREALKIHPMIRELLISGWLCGITILILLTLRSTKSPLYSVDATTPFYQQIELQYISYRCFFNYLEISPSP